MFKNFIKIAVRNLIKNKVFTSLNVFGLASGIACCILIMLYVRDEINFDKFHKKYDRIFRIIEERTNLDGSVSVIPLSSGLIGETAESLIPGIEESVRIISRGTTGRFTVQHGINKFYSGDHIFTSPEFFSIFDFELIEGDKNSALNAPKNVILTESAKEKYFGNEDAFGKKLSIESLGDFLITGIMKNPPANSHLNFDLVFSLATVLEIEGIKKSINSWNSEGILTYILLKPGYNLNEIRSSIKKIGEDNFSASEIQTRAISLQQLDNIHFYSGEMEDDYLNANPGDESYVYILSVVALFILLIACINFMNLSTAKSFSRAKEVGLRKVMGAFRTSLLKQFLGESLILSFISLFFSIILIELLFPLFNSLTGKNISINYLDDSFLLAIAGLTFFVGIISGSYPALYLSKFQPVKVLKGVQDKSKGKFSLRQVLVVVQFALAIIMIVSTIIVYQQLQYIQNKKLGFQKENLIVVDINSGDSRKSFREIKTEMLNHSEVIDVSTSSRVPGEWKNLPEVKVQPEGSEAVLQPYHITIDEDFIRTYSLELISGRNFSEKMISDSASVIINEKAAKIFGWKDPIGKILRMSDKYTVKVIGVVKDFHVESLHQEISPLVLGYLKNPYLPIDYFSIKTSKSNIEGVLDHLKHVHENFDKITPFEFHFLDEQINRFYINNQRMEKIFGIAALLSILIASLGLFALSSYMSEIRTKEIGIRKILGASVSGIVFMLSRDFAKWIIAANIIAWPIAYIAMNNWLTDFAYRINISIWFFLSGGFIALLIALLTISFQAVKAAAANPVKSLRHE